MLGSEIPASELGSVKFAATGFGSSSGREDTVTGDSTTADSELVTVR